MSDKIRDWLEAHGHTIEKDDPYYESIQRDFGKVTYTPETAFKYAVAKYASSLPLENFFVDKDYIYFMNRDGSTSPVVDTDISFMRMDYASLPDTSSYQILFDPDEIPYDNEDIFSQLNSYSGSLEPNDYVNFSRKISRRKKTVQELLLQKPKKISLEEIIHIIEED